MIINILVLNNYYSMKSVKLGIININLGLYMEKLNIFLSNVTHVPYKFTVLYSISLNLLWFGRGEWLLSQREVKILFMLVCL